MTAALRCDDCRTYYDPNDASHHQDGSETFHVLVDAGVLGQTAFDLCSISCLATFAQRRGPASRFTVTQATPLSSLDQSSYRAILWSRANIEQVRGLLDQSNASRPSPEEVDEADMILSSIDEKLAGVCLDFTTATDDDTKG